MKSIHFLILFCIVSLMLPASAQLPPANQADTVYRADHKDSNTNPVVPSGQGASPLTAGVEEAVGPVILRAKLRKTQTLPLSLVEALNLAVGQNISIQVAKDNAEIQRTDYLLRLSDLLPDISGEYRQSRLTGAVQTSRGEISEVERKAFQPQVTANYIVFTGGRNIFDIRASKQRLEALKQQTEEARQDILRQVAIAYYDLQQAYWQRGISLQAIREAEQQVALTQARYDHGIGLEIDVLQAKSNLSLREQELVQAEALISQASERLGQLLNLDFNVDIFPKSIDTVLTRLIPEHLGVEELFNIARQENPRLKALTHFRNAGITDTKVAIADLFPQINISAYANRVGSSLSDTLPARFAGIQASWNVLENMGTARPLAIRQAKANAQLAQHNLDQGKRLLEESMANALINLEALEKRIKAAKDTLAYSTAAHHQAAGRLQEGVGTSVELQLAVTNLSRARSDLASAFLDYNRIQAVLLFNMGVISVSTLTDGFKLRPNP